jgi:hypothetical protein
MEKREVKGTEGIGETSRGINQTKIGGNETSRSKDGTDAASRKISGGKDALQLTYLHFLSSVGFGQKYGNE